MLCHNVFAEVRQHLPTLPFAPPPYKSREMAVCINVALLLCSFRSMATIVHRTGTAACCFFTGTSCLRAVCSVGALNSTSCHTCCQDRLITSLMVPLVKSERASCVPKNAKSSHITFAVCLMMLFLAAVLRRDASLTRGLLSKFRIALFLLSCGK